MKPGCACLVVTSLVVVGPAGASDPSPSRLRKAIEAVVARPGRLTLRVHPAISVSGRSKDDAEALAEETRRVVAAGSEREVGE